MSNLSSRFLYTTTCSSFKWIDPLFFVLTSDRHTHTSTENTDGHEYSIVADDIKCNYLYRILDLLKLFSILSISHTCFFCIIMILPCESLLNL